MTRRLPGELVKEKLKRSMQNQEALKRELGTWLGEVARVLNEVSIQDLGDQTGDLIEARNAIDKALSIAERGQAKLNAATGHLAEQLGAVEMDHSLHDQRDAYSIVFNEKEFFINDQDTVQRVLEIVNPAVFQDAFSNLPVERQAELTGLASDFYRSRD